MNAADYRPATLAGRCASGAQRDGGQTVHVVPFDPRNLSALVFVAALCGAKPGRTSAGWHLTEGTAASCPRCVSKFSKLSRSQS